MTTHIRHAVLLNRTVCGRNGDFTTVLPLEAVQARGVCLNCLRSVDAHIGEFYSPTAEEVCNCLELVCITEDRQSYKYEDLMYEFTHIRKHESRCRNPHVDWIKQFWAVYAEVQEYNEA